ncbi:hypothetical protein [Saccharibacillus deserti]|uniref:hypothetical protein n=1 Tax=Saccharibacillus deserti TaxID=1634444 RepID=UPI001551D466|nr:hypothetical protein [Saccharibacillus deserti]
MTHPFARRIREMYPEMPITDVQTEHAARRYLVFTVNHRLVFQFARTEADAEALKRRRWNSSTGRTRPSGQPSVRRPF